MKTTKKKIFLDKGDVKEHFEVQKRQMEEDGLGEVEIKAKLSHQYSDKVIIKYSKEEQDIMLDYWIKMIQEVPGGYWQFIELMQQPHSEFQHYKCRSYKSYEKGNVSKQMARNELSQDAFEAYTERFIKELETL